jgi:ubiquinone biosynthesis protein
MIGRTLRIAVAAFGLLWAAAAERLHPRSGVGFPVRLRRTLERLGPTFIKLGQTLSQRRDMLPKRWTDELARLQADVAPFAPEVAVAAVEAALGASPDVLFASFEAQPMAAASVAQVHAARLHDGQEVIVKILRPGVRMQIDRDMRILVGLAAIATALIPFLRRRQTVALLREISRNLLRETDLREEARNIRRFARAFAGSPSVYIPDVVEALCSEGVLVQVMSRGRYIADPALKPQAGVLSKAFVDFYLQQFFVLGLFHADPHPGNIFVMADGRLCFHDFGAVGVLDAASRQGLMAFVQAFAKQDATWLTDAAGDLGLLSAEADRHELARGVEELLADLKGAPLQEVSIAGVMMGILRLGGDTVVMPPHLAALVRTVFTAEGALRTLDPNLDVAQSLSESGETLLASGELKSPAKDSVARLQWEAAVAVKGLPDAAARLLHRAGRGGGLPLRFPDVASAAGRVGRAADRIAIALVTLGLYIAASLLMQHSIGPRIFGDLPLLGAIGYALALWFTFRLVRSIDRTDGL